MTALQESTDHWHELMLCRTFAEVEAIGISSNECKLCDEFLNDACIGCPAKEKTMRTHCAQTPYPRIFEYYSAVLGDRIKFSQLHWYALARREYEFLRDIAEERFPPKR